MSADVNTDPPARANVSPAVIAAGAVAILALLAFLGYQTLLPKSYAPTTLVKNSGASQQAFVTWAKQKYQEVGGDYSKLAPGDQQRFTTASRGQGKTYFQSFKP